MKLSHLIALLLLFIGHSTAKAQIRPVLYFGDDKTWIDTVLTTEINMYIIAGQDWDNLNVYWLPKYSKSPKLIRVGIGRPIPWTKTKDKGFLSATMRNGKSYSLEIKNGQVTEKLINGNSKIAIGPKHAFSIDLNVYRVLNATNRTTGQVTPLDSNISGGRWNSQLFLYDRSITSYIQHNDKFYYFKGHKFKCVDTQLNISTKIDLDTLFQAQLDLRDMHGISVLNSRYIMLYSYANNASSPLLNVLYDTKSQKVVVKDIPSVLHPFQYSIWGESLIYTSDSLISFNLNSGQIEYKFIQPNYSRAFSNLTASSDSTAFFFADSGILEVNRRTQKLKLVKSEDYPFCNGLTCFEKTTVDTSNKIIYYLTNNKLVVSNGSSNGTFDIPKSKNWKFGYVRKDLYQFDNKVFIVQANKYNKGSDKLYICDFNQRNLLKLNAFFDENLNGQYDTDEFYMPNMQVESVNTNTFHISNFDGEIDFAAKPGNYKFQPRKSRYWKASFDSVVANIPNDTDKVFHLGYAPIGTFDSASVSIAEGFARCNRKMTIHFALINEGNSIIEGLYCADIDTRYSIDSIFEKPDSVYNNSYFFKAKLFPTSRRTYKFHVTVPGATSFNRVPVNKATFSSPVLNYKSVEVSKQVVRCSFDPNDKQVFPFNDSLDNVTAFDKNLSYTIRFQNTGNDTAFNITLVDTLDKNLNHETFRLQQSSHKVQTSLGANGALQFDFRNILLPDSNVDEASSHGFVKFSISPLPGLDAKTRVENTASIYFDYNDPIITNTVHSTYDSVFIVFKPELKALGLSVFPNPNNGKITIKMSEGSLQKAAVYDIAGGLKFEQNMLGNASQLDLTLLPKGTYILSITTTEGLETLRIIKQ